MASRTGRAARTSGQRAFEPLSSSPGPPEWRGLGCTPGTCWAKAVRDEAAVRLRLSSDGSQVLIEVWDADRWSPPAALFLVSALSARWGWYPTREPRGKVVWCQLEASGYEPTVSGSLPVAPSL